jgi:hypothetical protein
VRSWNQEQESSAFRQGSMSIFLDHCKGSTTATVILGKQSELIGTAY